MDRQQGVRRAAGLVGLPARASTLRRWLAWGLGLLGGALCALVLVGSVGLSSGWGATLLGLAFAAVPVGVVVPAFLWMDRLEAEPARLLLLAFAYGALVATAVALVTSTGTLAIIADATGQDPGSTGAVVVSPVVEETVKALGVVLVTWRRRELDGVVDGMVYAGLVAAGFAFGEDILYLGRAFHEAGADGLVATFVLRGVVGPFAHPLFTCCTGVGLGAAALSRSRAVRWGAPVAGWVVAVVLHAVWNLSAIAGLDGFLTRYALMQVPVFLAFVALAVGARRREARTVAVELGRYARAGWFTTDEVAMLSSVPARAQARRWARSVGGRDRRAAMERFQDASSDLAMLRHRMQLGVGDEQAAAQEQVLLGIVRDCRSRLAHGDGR